MCTFVYLPRAKLRRIRRPSGWELLARKSSPSLSQQLQLCRQPVPCSRCGAATEKALSSIRRRVRYTTRSPDEAHSADREGIHRRLMPVSPRCTAACVQKATYGPSSTTCIESSVRLPTSVTLGESVFHWNTRVRSSCSVLFLFSSCAVNKT